MDSSKPATRATVVPHQVLSAVSHELRGPLGVARGYLRLLIQGERLDARSSKAVQEASHATDRMAALLDELSSYARWVRGEARLRLTPVPLDTLLAVAVSSTELPVSPAVVVRVEAEADMTVQVDAKEFSTACGSLLAALVRAQTADVELVLSARSIAGGFELRISPAAGLDDDAEDAEILVERAGVGLGVALADLVVRLHGGTVAERRRGGVWSGYVLRVPRSA